MVVGKKERREWELFYRIISFEFIDLKWLNII